jgi:hypothetical protein
MQHSYGYDSQEGARFQGIETCCQIRQIKPVWMPEKISKPFVKKEKIETLE